MPTCNPLHKQINSVYKQKESNSKPNWELVKQYLPLLKSIVCRMLLSFPENIDRENIYTIGLLGLISASQTYKQSGTNQFATYASIRIRGTLIDELRRMDWLPRSLRLRIRKIQDQVEQLKNKFGPNLSQEEICNYLHITPQEYSKIQHYSKPVAYIPLDVVPQKATEEDEIYSLQDILADLNQENSRDVAERKEIHRALRIYLQELPRETQQIFALYYIEGLRLIEIARALQISESRICQIHAQGIEYLRKKLHNFLIQ